MSLIGEVSADAPLLERIFPRKLPIKGFNSVMRSRKGTYHNDRYE
jgi:hypothetical protein